MKMVRQKMQSRLFILFEGVVRGGTTVNRYRVKPEQAPETCNVLVLFSIQYSVKYIFLSVYNCGWDTLHASLCHCIVFHLITYSDLLLCTVDAGDGNIVHRFSIQISWIKLSQWVSIVSIFLKESALENVNEYMFRWTAGVVGVAAAGDTAAVGRHKSVCRGWWQGKMM